jgi:hypothetical protein
MVRAFNTLKRELKRQQNALLMDHQQEDVVSGGFANSIQFHFLLGANTAAITSSSVVDDCFVFDANQGAVGTSEVYFETRRDFYNPGRGF